MDKGAARSRKRANQLAKAPAPVAAGDNPVLKRLSEGDSRSDSGGRGGRGGGRGGRGGRGGHLGRERRDQNEHEAGPSRKPERTKKPELDEAIRYKPKAIRTSAALVWSEGAFDVPPSPERLDGVRRIDLSGSGITDISWVKGGVTWLSVAGCPIEKGWEAVGELKELSVKSSRRPRACAANV